MVAGANAEINMQWIPIFLKDFERIMVFRCRCVAGNERTDQSIKCCAPLHAAFVCGPELLDGRDEHAISIFQQRQAPSDEAVC